MKCVYLAKFCGHGVRLYPKRAQALKECAALKKLGHRCRVVKKCRRGR